MVQTSNFDADFNLRARHPVARLHLLTNVIESKISQHALKCSLDISYGNSDGQKIDVFPAKISNSPVFIFIHGGYFRALDKSLYRFIALQMVKQGYTVVLPNYDLAPKITVTEIVRQILASFIWVKENISSWNGNSDQITLCGHSVGAFLCAKILEQGMEYSKGIEKTALLSGLYDLAPMKQSYLNQQLFLNDEDVQRLNIRPELLKSDSKILVAVGASETSQFINQTKNLSAGLRSALIENEMMILPKINHYSMSRLLARQKNVLMNWIIG